MVIMVTTTLTLIQLLCMACCITSTLAFLPKGNIPSSFKDTRWTKIKIKSPFSLTNNNNNSNNNNNNLSNQQNDDDNTINNDNNNNSNNKRELNFLFHHGIDDERRPLPENGLPLQNIDFVHNWGITVEMEQHDNHLPSFPTTVDALTTEAWKAIIGTLYHKQRLDPNESSNAMTNSLHGYRPVRRKQDAGRIGIELDGARFLYPTHSVTETDAVRRIALHLAVKLSQGPWEGVEHDSQQPFHRPVAVYFNTIRQSLVASQELNILRRATLGDSTINTSSNGSLSSMDPLEQIIINTLGQDKTIPTHMKSQLGPHQRGLNKGKVIPVKGIIIIVQPTDYNNEFRPPGPAIAALGDLQQLTARATAENIAVVIVSPRFLVMDQGHWDQSGYQQSSTYGGGEPVKGPTPWVLRDFTPPVFCWVGNGVTLPGSTTRIALMQSVMHEAHSWHVFASKNDRTYRYLASTKTSSGRPSSHIMKLIYDEWAVE